MKEVMAIVRQNKVNETKEALALAGFPAFTCRRVLGRGKKAVDATIVQTILETGEVPVSSMGEHFTESTRLIPKRVFTLVVHDDDVNQVIKTIIDVNHTGNPGDGKIFVLPIKEAFRVRNGEQQTDSESY